MSDLPNLPTIGIDRGASFTDFAVIESGSLRETISIEKRDWQSIACLLYTSDAADDEYNV